MVNGESHDAKEYVVVVNDEEQYSIWPTSKALPEGWRSTGTRGPRADCLAHIADVWTDMRPLSLRRSMGDVDSGGSTKPRNVADRGPCLAGDEGS